MGLRVFSLAVVLVFGSACANGGLPILCSQIGVLAGAAGGAYALGDNTDKNTAVTAGGALGGAVVGALAGYYMCKLFEEEEQPAPAPRPKTAKAPPPPPPEVVEKIVLRGVNFDFDKSQVRPDAAVILDEAARLLQEHAALRVRVEGHTDWTGPEAYNQGLSERRAVAVRDHLAAAGVEASRLSTVGRGESSPMASNETREGRALNRRVELQVLE